MRNLKLCLAMLVPVVALACGRDDDTVVEDPYATEPPPAVTGMPGDTMMGADHGAMMNVTLSPVGGSTVSGQAMFMQQGDGTQVELQLTGAAGAGTHQAHIHQGTCDAPGQVVAPLESVTTDASGTGSSTSTVSVPFNDVFNGQHIVAAHQADASPGAPVVCGQIPAHTM
jgi:hypothetical protein